MLFARTSLVRVVGITASLTALLAIAGPGSALEPNRRLSSYPIKSWGAAEGLPQVSVTVLLQTEDGYLWLGTEEGLVRFDGVRFEVFDSRNTEAFTENYVTDIARTPDGGLLIATFGSGMLRYGDGEFTHLGEDDGLPTHWVNDLGEARDGIVWIATPKHVATWDGTRVSAEDLSHVLDGHQLTAIAEAHDGSLWIGTSAGALLVYRDGSAEKVPSPEGLAGDTINDLTVTADGALWICTERRGLFRWQDRVVERFGRERGLTSQAVVSATPDSDANLWIGTFDGGLCRLNQGGVSCLGTEDGLPNDTVVDVLEDHEGSLWLGLSGGGLVRMHDARFSSLTVRDGLTTNAVWAMVEGADGVWMSTDEGLNLVRDGRAMAVPMPELTDQPPFAALHVAADGCVWASTYGDLLWRRCDGVWRSSGPEERLTAAPVFDITETPDGTIWLGARDGLYRYLDGRFSTPGTSHRVTQLQIRALHVDRDGILWVGTYGKGIFSLDGDRVTELLLGPAATDRAMRVFCIHEHDDGTLWFGTRGGLVRHRGADVHVFTVDDGLHDDLIYQILDDDRGHLWLTSNRGVTRVSVVELEEVATGQRDAVVPTVFGIDDGMPSQECNGGSHPAGIRTTDGTMWFPTVAGVATVDPADESRNEVPPPVHIETVRVEGQPVAFDGPLQLTAGTRHLDIQYTALSFVAPHRVLFRHKLEGLDDDWIEAGAERTAHYTSLPPGHYTFRVIACNEDGVWNEHGAALALHKRPWFHQTPWFFALLVIAAIGGFVAVYRWRVRYLHQRQEELEELVDQRSRQLVEVENLLAEARHLPIRFGSYILVSILGEGGMARVYRAVREGPMGFRKELAIKRIKTDLTRDDERLVKAMINEARLGGQLKHPNVVDIYEFAAVGDQYYITMEFVDGWTLDALLEGAAIRDVHLPVGVCLDAVLQVCAGLAYAHTQTAADGSPLNLVHRDLKPANIIVSRAGQAKIMDFGIARSDDATYRTQATGVVKGTPRFMSPEQLQTPGDIDQRSDLFAVGGILYQALTGEALLGGPTVEALIWEIISGSFRGRLVRAEERIPGSGAILERCLDPDRDRRYTNAAELAEDLRHLHQGLGDPFGCADMTAALVAFAAGDDGALQTARERILAEAPAGGGWRWWFDSLATVPEEQTDPYRRPLQPPLGEISTSTQVSPTHTSITDPAEPEATSSATVEWTGERDDTEPA